MNTKIARTGVMLVLSSPSGAGKSTLSEMLLKDNENLAMSVSMTTRQPRDGEVEGTHYYFKTIEEFKAIRDDNALLEWAEVFGNFYGTPAAPVKQRIESGQDILFDIDWQGASQVYEKLGSDLVRVFILPPSHAALRERLTGRGQDSAEIIDGRMAKAAAEISHWPDYDYIIVNDDLDIAYQELQAILTAEQLKRARRTGMAAFVKDDLAV